MRSASSLLCVACVPLIAAACSTQGASTAGMTTREFDARGVEVVTSSVPAWSEAERWTVGIEPELEIGTEAGDPDSFLSNVGGVIRLDDGRVGLRGSRTSQPTEEDQRGSRGESHAPPHSNGSMRR